MNSYSDILDIVILGSGPAGLTAALYGARGYANTLVISGQEPGGQLMLTHSVENYPGIISSGPELIDKMTEQCKEFGAKFVIDHVTQIEQVASAAVCAVQNHSDNTNVSSSQLDHTQNTSNHATTENADTNTSSAFAQSSSLDSSFSISLCAKVPSATVSTSETATHASLFKLTTSQRVYYAKTVIIATGSRARWLDLQDIDKFKSNGVSTCATCDGFAYRGLTVAVIGGGNTAVEEALYLSKSVKEVILIHRRDTLRAEKIMQNALSMAKNVRYEWNSVASQLIHQDNQLTGLKIQNIHDKTEKNIALDGIFLAVGHEPNTNFVKDLLTLDEGGYIHTINTVETQIPGLYAAGDVIAESHHLGKQAVVAAGTGCTAAMKALKYLQTNATI